MMKKFIVFMVITNLLSVVVTAIMVNSSNSLNIATIGLRHNLAFGESITQLVKILDESESSQQIFERIRFLKNNYVYNYEGNNLSDLLAVLHDFSTESQDSLE